MVKNAVDVIYGGLSYWLYGFAFSFGTDKGNNGFTGVGERKRKLLSILKILNSSIFLALIFEMPQVLELLSLRD